MIKSKFASSNLGRFQLVLGQFGNLAHFGSFSLGQPRNSEGHVKKDIRCSEKKDINQPLRMLPCQ